jgi:hypothetical protein
MILASIVTIFDILLNLSHLIALIKTHITHVMLLSTFIILYVDDYAYHFITLLPLILIHDDHGLVAHVYVIHPIAFLILCYIEIIYF